MLRLFVGMLPAYFLQEMDELIFFFPGQMIGDLPVVFIQNGLEHGQQLLRFGCREQEMRAPVFRIGLARNISGLFQLLNGAGRRGFIEFQLMGQLVLGDAGMMQNRLEEAVLPAAADAVRSQFLGKPLRQNSHI